tara:strand:+ start:920 stop:1684 length:765 start_codon:yes stop_codon:yes gene_type:complete
MKITKSQLRQIVKEEFLKEFSRHGEKGTPKDGEQGTPKGDLDSLIAQYNEAGLELDPAALDAEWKEAKKNPRLTDTEDEWKLARIEHIKANQTSLNSDALEKPGSVANRKEVREDRMAGMAGQRPSDMFGRVVLVRDIKSIPIEKADGRDAVKHERVRYKGIIQKPDIDPENYPDGGLPGFRESGRVLLNPDQPVIVSLQDGTKISQLASGTTLTLADLVTQREMMSLFKEWKAASPKGRKSLEWSLFVSRQQQ